MNVGMTGLIASAAGVPLAQTQGSEIERGQIDSAARQRTKTSEFKAENAAGIGAADGEDHDTQDRDADGRRPWEIGGEAPTEGTQPDPSEGGRPQQSRDATGERGNGLDLTA